MKAGTEQQCNVLVLVNALRAEGIGVDGAIECEPNRDRGDGWS
jgi:hypothetical protein